MPTCSFLYSPQTTEAYVNDYGLLHLQINRLQPTGVGEYSFTPPITTAVLTVSISSDVGFWTHGMCVKIELIGCRNISKYWLIARENGCCVTFQSTAMVKFRCYFHFMGPTKPCDFMKCETRFKM